MKEALFYQPKENKKVQCQLCPRTCLLSEGEKGFCRVRINKEGKLFSLVYGKPCSLALDPIEKKPFYHFLPGSFSLSLATVGCNLKCKYCQNWRLSQSNLEEIPYLEMPPEKIIEKALLKGVPSISYTYTEPTVFYEYLFDLAKLAKKQKIKNLLVTNGYICPSPLKKIAPFIDAVNVDLKGYSESFYQKVCSASLKPVLESLKLMKKLGLWIEITYLLVPGYNDDLTLFEKMCYWLKENLGKDVPLHLSRFFPQYQFSKVKPTPWTTLKKTYSLAVKYLDYVYLGNVFKGKEENTYCPHCGKLLIKRRGILLENKLSKGSCSCGAKIKGVW